MTPKRIMTTHHGNHMKYRIEFMGRKINSLGVWSRYVAVRDGETESAAVKALYDEWEHIHSLVIHQILEPDGRNADGYITMDADLDEEPV